MGLKLLKATLAGAVVLASMAGAALAQDKTVVGLITKTETNPFFVKMREGATAKAAELGIELITAAGKFEALEKAGVTTVRSPADLGKTIDARLRGR